MSARRPSHRMLELKVGAFLVAILLVGMGVIFVLGSKKHVFEERVVLHANFKEVAGLREGAPVRLSGVNVGLVVLIAFQADRADTRVRVDLEVSRAALDRIRKDSIARIGAQGLLGDKIIEIAQGSPAAPQIEPNGTLATADAIDLNRVIEQAAQTIERAKVAANGVANLMEGLSDQRTMGHLRASLVSIRDILSAIEKGPGLAHTLFYERSSADDFSQLSHRLVQLIAHADATVSRIDKLLASTNDQGMQVINNLAVAAKRIGETADQLGRSKIIAELGQASGDIAALTRFIRSGRGTVGGIIVDPTIYEKLVTIVGGVERSRVLRALVRYAISKDDGQDNVRTLEPIHTHPGP